MEHIEYFETPVVEIRPASVFALVRASGLLIAAVGFLLLAWRLWPALVWLSLLATTIAGYRYLLISRIRYTVTARYLDVRRGLIFQRIDRVALHLISDYVLLQPPALQLLRLMHLQLITADPENPEIWLRGIPRSLLVELLRERVLEARTYNAKAVPENFSTTGENVLAD